MVYQIRQAWLGDMKLVAKLCSQNNRDLTFLDRFHKQGRVKNKWSKYIIVFQGGQFNISNDYSNNKPLFAGFARFTANDIGQGISLDGIVLDSVFRNRQHKQLPGYLVQAGEDIMARAYFDRHKQEPEFFYTFEFLDKKWKELLESCGYHPKGKAQVKYFKKDLCMSRAGNVVYEGEFLTQSI